MRAAMGHSCRNITDCWRTSRRRSKAPAPGCGGLSGMPRRKPSSGTGIGAEIDRAKIMAGPRPPTENFFTTNRLLMLDGALSQARIVGAGNAGSFPVPRFRKSRPHGRVHGLRRRRLAPASAMSRPRIISAYSCRSSVTAATARSTDSTTQIVDYSSTYSSFETNYRVRQRLRRDQMVMDANGNWHRADEPGLNREYLVGLRYMELRDILDWRARGYSGHGQRRHVLDPHRQRHVRLPDGRGFDV